MHVIVDSTNNERSQTDVAFPLGATLSNKPYNICQAYESTGVITSSTIAATFAQLSFTLSALDQSSSLTALFDQYRIVRVEAKFYPDIYQATSGVNIPLSVGLITSVIDYDDDAALTTVGQALDYQNELTVECGCPFTRTLAPHVADALYSGAFTSFGNKPAPWIDAASPGVIHYGLKLACTQTVVAVRYSAVIRMHVQFRNVR